jgi:thymidylate kinase
MDSKLLMPLSATADAGLEAPNWGAQNLVVEFLGVSGSGKSTLARALAARFKQRGYCMRLLTMQRQTVSQRLLGVLYKSGNMCRIAFSHRHEFAEARALLRLFPQKSVLHHTRVMQYLLHLSALRARLKSNHQIVIFDQGFVQAMYSLALFSSASGDSEFDAAFHAMPEPDILITLNPSADTVAKRLGKRRGLARVARVTVNDRETMRRSFDLITRIEGILSESGCRVIHYCPGHTASIEESTDDLFHALQPIVGEAGWASASAAIDRRQARWCNIDELA